MTNQRFDRLSQRNDIPSAQENYLSAAQGEWRQFSQLSSELEVESFGSQCSECSAVQFELVHQFM